MEWNVLKTGPSTYHIHILCGQCECIVGGGGQPEQRTFRFVHRILSYGFRACYRIGGVVNVYSNAFDVTHCCADHILQFTLPINACTCRTQQENKQQNYLNDVNYFERKKTKQVSDGAHFSTE